MLRVRVAKFDLRGLWLLAGETVVQKEGFYCSRFSDFSCLVGVLCLKGKIKSEKERFEDSELTDWFLAIDACLA